MLFNSCINEFDYQFNLRPTSFNIYDLARAFILITFERPNRHLYCRTYIRIYS